MSTSLVTRTVSELLRSPREHQGHHVITFAQVDAAHARKPGHAKRTFFRVRDRMTEGRDFFNGERGSPLRGGRPVLLTMSGYLLLVKPFTDGLSWAIQGFLVENYFGRALERAAVAAVEGRDGRVAAAQDALVDAAARIERLRDAAPEPKKAVRDALTDVLGSLDEQAELLELLTTKRLPKAAGAIALGPQVAYLLGAKRPEHKGDQTA